MPQPYVDVTGLISYQKAVGNGTISDPYVPVTEGSITLDLGNKIDAATIPAGGVGNLGWLSAIWKLISDRIPVLSVNNFSAVSNSLTNTPFTIKESAGFIMGWNAINLNTKTVYIKFYDSNATNTTIGESLPIFTLAIPGGNDNNPGIFFKDSSFVPHGAFNNAIAMACVTGLNVNSTTPPTIPIYIDVNYR